MNKLIRNEQGNYIVECENGDRLACSRWFEKKTNAWHVKLPANNPTGRTYIRESLVPPEGYEFETKTEHRTGLSTGGWRSKLTEEEKAKLQSLELEIEAIKQLAMSRETPKLEKGSKEWLEAEIAKCQAKLEKLKVGE